VSTIVARLLPLPLAGVDSRLPVRLRAFEVLNPKMISMSDAVAVMTGAMRPDELPANALA